MSFVHLSPGLRRASAQSSHFATSIISALLRIYFALGVSAGSSAGGLNESSLHSKDDSSVRNYPTGAKENFAIVACAPPLVCASSAAATRSRRPPRVGAPAQRCADLSPPTAGNRTAEPGAPSSADGALLAQEVQGKHQPIPARSHGPKTRRLKTYDGAKWSWQPGPFPEAAHVLGCSRPSEPSPRGSSVHARLLCSPGAASRNGSHD